MIHMLVTHTTHTTHTTHKNKYYQEEFDGYNAVYCLMFLTGGLLDRIPIITDAISLVANAALLLGSLR